MTFWGSQKKELENYPTRVIYISALVACGIKSPLALGNHLKGISFLGYSIRNRLRAFDHSNESTSFMGLYKNNNNNNINEVLVLCGVQKTHLTTIVERFRDYRSIIFIETVTVVIQGVKEFTRLLVTQCVVYRFDWTTVTEVHWNPCIDWRTKPGPGRNASLIGGVILTENKLFDRRRRFLRNCYIKIPPPSPPRWTL